MASLNRTGVCLTWKELCVKVSNGGSKDGCKPILQSLTGYASPGEVLAVMGPSGSGKSTLLDALAGRLDSNKRQSGEILVNGQKQKLAYGTSAYVTQDDVLIWTLTVREALYYSAQLQLPNTVPKTQRKETAEKMIKEMGLQDSMDKRIGSLSGGQKRRVSICTEILMRPKILFLDEPTSGLDSAASYHVMSRIMRFTRQHGMTVVASLHQPTSEVFKLLNNLCLLSLGRTVYFGPSFAARQFFRVNGLECPTFQNPADHYLRIINTDFDDYEDIEQGGGGKMTGEEVIDELVKSYNSSATYKQVQKQVAEMMSKEENGLMEKQRSQSSFLTECSVLSRRSFVNMYRDLGYYWLRFAIYIALGMGLGTVFFDIGSTYNSIHARGSMLMFVTSLLTIMAIGGFPSFVEDMKIFRRERLNGHYGVAAFVIGNAISSLPFLLLISVIPGAIAYYLAGLQPGLTKFLYFTSILLCCMMLVESLMMIVASMVPNFLMGLVVGAGIQGLMMLSGGFFQLPDDLPKLFWRYPLYYIAFHKYAFQGLYKNEFEGMVFQAGDRLKGSPAVIDGGTILKNVWEVETGYSKWVDLAVLLGMVIVYRVLFFGVIKVGENAKPRIRRGLICCFCSCVN
nr:ABC transporter G family member 11-like [Ipomoea batatas]